MRKKIRKKTSINCDCGMVFYKFSQEIDSCPNCSKFYNPWASVPDTSAAAASSSSSSAAAPILTSTLPLSSSSSYSKRYRDKDDDELPPSTLDNIEKKEESRRGNRAVDTPPRLATWVVRTDDIHAQARTSDREKDRGAQIPHHLNLGGTVENGEDIVRLLEVFKPDELQRIREKYPESASRLRSGGVMLGGAEDQPLAEAADALLLVLAEVARDAASRSTRQLSVARRFELLGQILGIASSATVVGVSLTGKSPWAAAIVAAIGILANAIPLIVNWLRGSISGARVADLLVELRDIAWDAAEYRKHITRADSNIESEALISRSNGLAKRARTALSELGYSANFSPI